MRDHFAWEGRALDESALPWALVVDLLAEAPRSHLCYAVRRQLDRIHSDCDVDRRLPRQARDGSASHVFYLANQMPERVPDENRFRLEALDPGGVVFSQLDLLHT